MIYKLNLIEDKLLEEIYQESMADLNIFYELNWRDNQPRVIVIDDRKTINSLKGLETENWVICTGPLSLDTSLVS